MRTRPGLKTLGLSVLMIGVMAIGTAGVAQAEVGACWSLINPANGKLECFPSNLEPKVEIALEERTGTLLIENTNLEILCAKGALVTAGGTLGPEGTVLLGKVLFSECIGLERGPPLGQLKILSACTPTDPKDGFGTVVTENILGLIVLHNGEPVLLLKDDSALNENLATIFMSSECPVGDEIIIKGELILQDTRGKTAFETHATSHLIQEFTGLQLMKVGTKKATLDGTAIISLVAPHNALKWAGHAG